MKESHLLVESDSTESRTVKNSLFFPKNGEKTTKKVPKSSEKMDKKFTRIQIRALQSNTDNAIVLAQQCGSAGAPVGALKDTSKREVSENAESTLQNKKNVRLEEPTEVKKWSIHQMY